MSDWTFKFDSNYILMPAVSIFGLIGNSYSIYNSNTVRLNTIDEIAYVEKKK